MITSQHPVRLGASGDSQRLTLIYIQRAGRGNEIQPVVKVYGMTNGYHRSKLLLQFLDLTERWVFQFSFSSSMIVEAVECCCECSVEVS